MPLSHPKWGNRCKDSRYVHIRSMLVLAFYIVCMTILVPCYGNVTQVVALLAAFEYMAENFPGAFSGYSLQVRFYSFYPFIVDVLKWIN